MLQLERHHYKHTHCIKVNILGKHFILILANKKLFISSLYLYLSLSYEHFLLLWVVIVVGFEFFLGMSDYLNEAKYNLTEAKNKT